MSSPFDTLVKNLQRIKREESLGEDTHRNLTDATLPVGKQQQRLLSETRFMARLCFMGRVSSTDRSFMCELLEVQGFTVQREDITGSGEKQHFIQTNRGRVVFG